MVIFKQPSLGFAITGIYTTLELRVDKNFNFTGESHPFPEIVYIKSGSAEVVENDKAYTLDEGDMIYHAAGEFHRIRSANGSEPTFYILSCCYNEVEPAELREGMFSLSEQLRREYESIFDMLYSFNYCCDGECRGRKATNYSIDVNLIGKIGLSRLTAFLLGLPHMATSSAVLSRASGAKAYREAVRFMEMAVDANASLSEIAAALHFSKSYITKLFSKFAGLGPIQYYTRLRIERIKSLLTEGRGIAEIAAMLSFSSPSYMSSFFKEFEGVAPTEWLKKQNTVFSF
ncbi:MAG: helix-turn-helix domain-containing protein [Clostridia bacterium]|nr:helix-turn-helix domain-containing protein [Clostridia bacterium]